MVYTAPAKLNLYLDVLKRRDDGYHEIETLFEKISLCDKLAVEISSGSLEIKCSDPSIPLDEKSLLGRTIKKFCILTGKKNSFKIFLEKNIPVGGGLGGGSSDAACLLKALNEISGFPLKAGELLETARTLGADVPLFLYDGAFTIGKGRGDVISEVETGLTLWHVLVTPPFGISTAEIYGGVSPVALTNKGGADKMFSAFLRSEDAVSIAKNLRNDLQKIALEKFPSLGPVFSEIKKKGAEGALLSGSGSTVFGIFASEEAARKAGKELEQIFQRNNGWRVFTVATFGHE